MDFAVQKLLQCLCRFLSIGSRLEVTLEYETSGIEYILDIRIDKRCTYLYLYTDWEHVNI